MTRYDLSIILCLPVIMGFAAICCVSAEPENGGRVKAVELPSVSGKMLKKYEKRRVTDWLRCPRFYTKDSRRTEMENRKPGDIARMVRDIARNEGAAFRLGGYWGGEVYFQSEVAPHAPGLGDMDFLDEGTEEGKRLGVKIVMYMNPSAFYPEHPLFEEVIARLPDGQPTDYGRLGATVICTNHPKYRRFLTDVLEEAFTNYELDGLYVDGLSPHRCCCEHCRAKYRQMWNEDMPVKKLEDVRQWWALWEMVSEPVPVGDPADEDLERYRQFLAQSQVEISQLVHDTVKGCEPEAVVLFHTWPKPDTAKFYDATLTEIYVKRPWIHKAWKYGELANLGSTFDIPSLCNIYLEHGTADEARYKMFQVLANGAYPNCWHFPAMEQIFRFLRENAKYYDFARTRPVRFLAIPREIHLSQVHRKLAGKKLGYHGSLEHFLLPGIGLYAALTRAGLPANNLHAADFHRELDGCRVLCLSQLAGMSPEQVERVRRFVADGGGLIATFESSLFNHKAQRQPDFQLADVFGVSYEGTLPAAEREIHFIEESETRSRSDKDAKTPDEPYPSHFRFTDPIAHGESHLLVRPTTGRVMARLRGEGDADGAPAVIANRFGKGRVVYFPSRPDLAEAKQPSSEIERLFEAAVHWLAQDEPPVEVETEELVGVTVYDQPDRRLVHMVSHNADSRLRTDEVRPVGEAGVRFRIPEGRLVTRLHTLWNKREVPFKAQGGRLSCQLKPLGHYEVLVAELGSPRADNEAAGAKPPVEVEQKVIAQLGSEHFANAVYRKARAGARIASWGDRILQWPIASAAPTEEVVSSNPDRHRYSNGGCAIDLNSDGIDEVVVAEIKSDRNGSDLVWYEEPPSKSRWREHLIAHLKHGRYGAPHDILPLPAADSSGRRPEGVAAVISRKRLVWFEIPEDIRSPWAGHPIATLPGSRQSGMAIGDIAGRGRPDIACGMFWVECPADLRSGPWKFHRYGTWDENGWGGMTKHGLGDMNGDGRIDIVAAEAEIPDSRLAVFSRDQDSPDGLWKCRMVDTGLYCPHSLVLADVNDDNRLDIIVGEMTAGGWKYPMNPKPRILLYLNRGGLEFTRHTLAVGWGVHEMKSAPVGPADEVFIYAADEIQLQKFSDMKTHVVGWRISPR